VDVIEAIRTTRAMRRLDPERRVSEEDLLFIIDAATRAASGGNTQPVRWLVVTDYDLRRRLGEVYGPSWREFRDHYLNDPDPSEQTQRGLRSADHLADNFGKSPAIIVVCSRNTVAASVFPGVQNLMLAARSIGLGTTLTTAHVRHEDEVRAILGIPADVKTHAMIPVGYPLGRWGEAERLPPDAVTYWNGWRNKGGHTTEGEAL
jgi:nitroreductase